MSDFNPDQFLTDTAPKADAGFNPDQFLSETGDKKAAEVPIWQKALAGIKNTAQRMFPRTSAEVTGAIQNGNTEPNDPLALVKDVGSGVGTAISHLPGMESVGRAEDWLMKKVAPKGQDYPLQDIYQPAIDRLNEMPYGGLPASILQTIGAGTFRPSTWAGGVGEIPAVKNAVTAASDMARAGSVKSAAAIGEKLTNGIPAQALEVASTGPGRASLAASAANAGPAGSNLADAVANFTKKMPEEAIVNQALAKTGKIDIQPAIDAFEKAKLDIPTKSGITGPQGDAALKAINDMISRLKTSKSGQALGGTFDADEYRQIRQIIDEGIDFDQPGYKAYSDAAMKARTAMKDALIKAAPPEYADAMKSWHDKLNLVDEIKSRIGQEEGVGQDIRAGSFLNQVANEAEGGPRRKLLQQFDEAGGHQFLKDSDTRKLALKFGEKGVPSWMPKITPVQGMSEAAGAAGLGYFGHPVLSGILGSAAVAGSMPAVAARAINAARLPPWLLAQAAKYGPAASAAAPSSSYPPSLQGAR
jgi:hypothetical protein